MRPNRFIAPLLLFFSVHAFADWTDSGLAYRCNRGNGSFAIESVMKSSAPETVGNVEPRPGFVVLSASRSVQCVLGRTKVGAKFHVRPPQATGTCGGINQISIDRLRVNGKPIFESPRLFNFYCLEDEALHSVEINTTANGPRVRICHAQWDWHAGYHSLRCEERDA